MGYSIVLPGGLVRTPSLRGILTAASVENAPLTITLGGAALPISANTTKPFLFCYQQIIANAGSYTRPFTLDQANAFKGSMFIFEVEIAAGTDATLSLQFYDHTTGGANIENLSGRPDASYILFVARNTGTNWEKLITAYNL